MVQGHSFENLWIWIGYFDDNEVTGLHCPLWWFLLLLASTIKVFVNLNIGWDDNFYIGFIPTKILIWRSFALLENDSKKKRKEKNIGASNQKRMRLSGHTHTHLRLQLKSVVAVQCRQHSAVRHQHDTPLPFQKHADFSHPAAHRLQIVDGQSFSTDTEQNSKLICIELDLIVVVWVFLLPLQLTSRILYANMKATWYWTCRITASVSLNSSSVSPQNPISTNNDISN